MEFEQAVEAVRANAEEKFLGVTLLGDRLEIYEIYADEEEPDYIGINMEGGRLFSPCGEEDFLSIDEAPELAKKLTYRSQAKLPSVAGYTSEYALKVLFDELPEPGPWMTNQDRVAFARQATKLAQESWLYTG